MMLMRLTGTQAGGPVGGGFSRRDSFKDGG